MNNISNDKMNTKRKGSNAERELIHMFWDSGFAAMRAAGSGSIGHPSPDIIAGNGFRRLAIECKVTKSNNKYFTSQEISDLSLFCTTFGAEGYVAVKFPKKEWAFFILEDLKETKSNYYAISINDCDMKSLNFKQLLD